MDRAREASFGTLLERNTRRLMSIAKAYARGEDARDLHQEILLQIWRSLDGFEARSSLDTWVYRVALNTALTWKRKVPRAAAVPAAEPGSFGERAPSGSSRGGERSETAILEEFIGTLGEIDRALLLMYLDDLTYSEMAGVTGLSESNVGVRLHRTRKAFVSRYIGEPA